MLDGERNSSAHGKDLAGPSEQSHDRARRATWASATCRRGSPRRRSRSPQRTASRGSRARRSTTRSRAATSSARSRRCVRPKRVAILPWSPLAGGLLSGKFDPDKKGPADARRASFDFPPVNMERLPRVSAPKRPRRSCHGPFVLKARRRTWPSVAVLGIGCGTPLTATPVAHVPRETSVEVGAPSAYRIVAVRSAGVAGCPVTTPARTPGPTRISGA